MPAKTIYDRIALAIMEFEGYFEGSASFRNKNPGNLKAAGQPGVVSKDVMGHAIFASFEDGYRALVEQVRMMFDGRSKIYNPEMNFYDVFSRYAEANSKSYAEFVAGRLGVGADTQLKKLT